MTCPGSLPTRTPRPPRTTERRGVHRTRPGDLTPARAGAQRVHWIPQRHNARALTDPAAPILADVGVTVVLSGFRMPRMNSIMERWVQACRHELLDRTLIWNQRHLLHTLREFEQFYNGHRPHQGIANARPLCPLPPQIADPDMLARLNIRKRDR